MPMNRLIFLFIFTHLIACTLDTDKGELKFNFRKEKPQENSQNEKDQMSKDSQKITKSQEEILEEINKQKEDEWQQILTHAKQDFEPLREIFSKKCFDCHNSNRDLPFYGKIFKKINPVTKHQVSGLKALDMAKIFPLKAKGDPSQIALLKAIKSSVIDRTMPLSSYTFVYPSRKLNNDDQDEIVIWVESLIDEIERFETKYINIFSKNDIRAKGKRLISNKCLRCHGNGVAKGGLGGMEDFDTFSKNKKYINLSIPEESYIYKISASQEMPIDKRDALTTEELQVLADYIVSFSD